MFLLGCLMTRAETFYFYNWDTGTYLYNAIALCLILDIISKPSAFKSFFLGVAIALMTLGRVPSGIFLPCVIILILISSKYSFGNNPKVTFRLLCALVCGWILTMIVLTWIILGNPLDYFGLFKSENIISGHNPVKDIPILHGRFAQMILDLDRTWFFGIICSLLAILFVKLKCKTTRFIILCIWIVYTVLYSYYYTAASIEIDFNFGMAFPIAFALLSALPILCVFKKTFVITSQYKLMLWAVGLLILSTVFGSDSITSRLAVGYILPSVVSVLWVFKNKDLNDFIRNLIGISLISFSALMTTHIIRVRSIMAIYEKSVLFPYQGLKLRAPVYDEISSAGEAIQKVRKAGIPYVYIGEPNLAELSFGVSEGVSFHEYHTSLNRPRDWHANKCSFIDKVDAAVYTPVFKESDFYKILDDLKKEGFDKEELVGNAVILYRNERKNPNKIYPKLN